MEFISLGRAVSNLLIGRAPGPMDHDKIAYLSLMSPGPEKPISFTNQVLKTSKIKYIVFCTST